MYNTSSFGKWETANRSFYNKRDALIYASNNGCPDVSWNWHNDVWKNFNIEKLGKQSLPQLYRERAQQLRDTYDYLILSYSGGADSHNILMTFLDNNIKLDLVYIQSPFSFINSSQHAPNSVDKTARNQVCEWDYCIKPTLEYLAKYHPNIKIELSDWMDNVTESYFSKENTFLNSGGSNLGMGTMARSLNFSKFGLSEFEKDKKVATIYGCDKPVIAVDSQHKKVSMTFSDVTMLHCTNSVGTFEPFYWSQNLPDLIFEMAHQVYLHYKTNPTLQQFMWSKANVSKASRDDNIISMVNQDIVKKACYPLTWDFNKFQADKPIGLRADRDFFVYEYDDFNRIKDTWKYHYEVYYQGINKKYINDVGNLKLIHSNLYYIGDL